MEIISSIRTELDQYISKYNLTLSRFAEIAGMNCGTISTILKGQRSIAVNQLDKIISGMELPPGSLYEAYAYECFIQAAPNWRRLRPFIYRCAELNMLSTIELTVRNVLDNLTYAPLLFDVAEDLFQQDKKEAAAILYTCVAECEKYQHSERLAVCQYRLFKIALTDNKDTNLQAAVRFEPYVDRLDDADQLDALKDLANLYMALRRWNKSEQLVSEMGRKAKILYDLKHNGKNRKKIFKEPSKPLFGYILYAYLLLGNICEELEDYRQALYYVSLYEDTSWVIEQDEEAEKHKNIFKIWALGNKYSYQLMNGNISVLPKYIEYSSTYENETFPALFVIVRAANKFNLDIDELIESYDIQITNYLNGTYKIKHYTNRVFKDGFSHFLADLAKYYFQKSNFQKGFQYTLGSLTLALELNSESCVTRGVALFEEHKSKTTKEFLLRYEEIKKRLYY